MKKLIFVTSTYPFGTEEPFVENEIKYLSESFDKIYIYATKAHETESKRPVPENVTVFSADPTPVSKTDYLKCIFKPPVIKEIFKNCLKGNFIRKVSACCYFYSCFAKSLKMLHEFLKLCKIERNDKVTIYSYWLSTVGMCAVKIHDSLQKAGIKSKLVSRCHGFDVYSEDSYAGFIPFQEYTIDRMDAVFPCSNRGVDYLSKKYPDKKEKLYVAYLGVKDHFTNRFPQKGAVFNVVSCSNVIPSKRVNSILEALSRITDTNISWTHFGDGQEIKKIKAQAEALLPKNVSCSFPGRVPNSEIYRFYNDNDINLFLNASTSEGVPVSIMEACSFGIPIIATDVGGISEIVSNGKNGLLLKSDFSIEDYVQALNTIINLSPSEYESLCRSSRNVFWGNFDAKNCYTKFCKIITADNT